MRNYSVTEVADYLADGFWRHQAQTYDYSYSGPPVLNVAGGTVGVSVETLTAANKVLARAALSAWESVTGLDFVERKRSSAEVVLLDDNYSRANTQWVGGQAVVNIGGAWNAAYGNSLSGYTYQTWLHEIGHTLGLGHAGPYNGKGKYGSDNIYLNDSWQMTVMSYFPQDENTSINGTRAYVLTPMPADIEALNRLYGVHGAAGAGDTVYGDRGNAAGWVGKVWQTLTTGGFDQPVAIALYDLGGNDTLRLTSYAGSQTIRLEPGSASDIHGARGNLVIAENTVIENVTTGAGDDRIFGQDADNVIRAGAGHDSVAGGAGDDRLYGYAGNDTLLGEQGNDWLAGGAGADVLNGGAGTDTAWWGDSATDVTVDLANPSRNAGGAAGDRLISIENLGGSPGDDSLYGDARDNAIAGGAGDDFLVGRGGNDTLSGGVGDDRLQGGAGSDKLVGGEGRDTADYTDATRGVVINLAKGIGAGDRLLQIENVEGSAFADRLLGDDGDNLLAGGRGADTLIGGGGKDTLDGGAGDDELWGGDGADIFVLALGNDRVMDFAAGVDKLLFTSDPVSPQDDFDLDYLLAAGSVDNSGHAVFQLGQGARFVVENVGSIAALADDILIA